MNPPLAWPSGMRHSRTVFTVLLPMEPPFSRTVKKLYGRASYSVKFSIQSPLSWSILPLDGWAIFPVKNIIFIVSYLTLIFVFSISHIYLLINCIWNYIN